MYIYVVLLAKLKETHKPSLSLFQWIFLMKLRFLGFYVFCLRLNCVLRFFRILCWRIWLLDGFQQCNWYCFTSLVCYVKKIYNVFVIFAKILLFFFVFFYQDSTMSSCFSPRFYIVFVIFAKITMSLCFSPRFYNVFVIFHHDSILYLWFFTKILQCLFCSEECMVPIVVWWMSW